MKSTKLVILLVVFALVLGAYFFAGDLLGRGAVSAVNKYGPQLTDTQVTLGGAHLSPFTGGGSMTALFVGNPTGFKTAKAFSVGRTALKVKPLSLLSGTIDVEEVVVEKPEFIYESKLISSNLGTILDNIARNSGAKGQPPAAGTQDSTTKKLIIRHFVLEAATVTVVVGEATLTVPLARLELHDIGVAKGGATPAEVAAEILPQVLNMVTQTAIATLGDRAFRDKAVDFGKELGNAAQELIDQVRGK